MRFHIKASVKSLKKAERRALDADVTAILGNMADDAQINGVRVWRKYGNVELFDNTTTKIIYGDAEPKTIAALREVLTNYGCKIA